LRKDIFDYTQVKYTSYFMKRYFSKLPFYNSLLKNRILWRAAKSLKNQSRRKYKKITEATRNKFLKYLAKAERQHERNHLFESNQPNIPLEHRKLKWHSKVKKKSSFLFKHNFLNKKSRPQFDSNSNFVYKRGGESFLFKKASSALLFYTPISVNNFFYSTKKRKKRIIGPRLIKNFSERRYQY
jgi:hypothetical protein